MVLILTLVACLAAWSHSWCLVLLILLFWSLLVVDIIVRVWHRLWRLFRYSFRLRLLILNTTLVITVVTKLMHHILLICCLHRPRARIHYNCVYVRLGRILPKWKDLMRVAIAIFTAETCYLRVDYFIRWVPLLVRPWFLWTFYRILLLKMFINKLRVDKASFRKDGVIVSVLLFHIFHLWFRRNRRARDCLGLLTAYRGGPILMMDFLSGDRALCTRLLLSYFQRSV